MKLEGGQEARDGIGSLLPDQRNTVVLGDRSAGKRVDAASSSDQNASAQQPDQVLACDAASCEISGPDDPLAFCEFKNLLSIGIMPMTVGLFGIVLRHGIDTFQSNRFCGSVLLRTPPLTWYVFV